MPTPGRFKTGHLLVAVILQKRGIRRVACLFAPLIGVIARLKFSFVEFFKASLHTLSGEACIRVCIPTLLDGADNSVKLLQGRDCVQMEGERGVM